MVMTESVVPVVVGALVVIVTVAIGGEMQEMGKIREVVHLANLRQSSAAALDAAVERRHLPLEQV